MAIAWPIRLPEKNFYINRIGEYLAKSDILPIMHILEKSELFAFAVYTHKLPWHSHFKFAFIIIGGPRLVKRKKKSV